MLLIKVVNDEPVWYSEAAFRADNKQTIYGAVLSDRHLNPQGVYRVSVDPAPKETGKVAVRDTTPVLANGQWQLGWTLRAMDADESRAERNALLAATDWMAVSDRTMSDPDISYRQALRDLPAQAGFPDTTGWPVKP